MKNTAANTHKSAFDAHVIPFILFYAIVYMSQASFGPYLNAYYRTLGFEYSQIAVISALGPFISIAAQPLWGILSDRTNKKRVLVIIVTGTIVTSLLYALQTIFLYICFIAVLYNFFQTSITPLSDAMTLQYIEGKKTKFSSIRLVGTISYAVMAAIVGRLLNNELRLIFFVNAGMLGAALAMAIWMPNIGRPAAAETKDGGSPEAVPEEKISTWQGIKALFKNKMLICVFLASFVTGLAMSFYYTFTNMHLMDDLGANSGQIGMAMLISAASEIPVLLIVNKIISKLKPIYILMLVGAALGLRMFLLYNSTTIGMVYVAQLLHGLTFMLPYYFSALLISQNAPPNLKSTAQSVYAMCRGGLVSLLNIGIGGLAQKVGLTSMYLFFSIFVTLVCCVLPGLLYLIYNLRQRGKNKPLG